LAKAAGAVIQTETRVNSAGKNAGNWEILSSSGNAEHIHTAEVVVNAAGAWLNALRPSGSVDKVARAFARHLFTLQAPSSDAGLLPDTGFLWDERDYFYIRKLSGGRALFSLCDESEIDPDAEPSGESLHKLLGEKLELYAAKFGAVWSGAPEIFAQRWCLRTYHPDQLPILCKDPQHAGYFWIGAFGGFGMSTGFAAAEDLARIISGEAEQNPEFALRPAP